MRRIQTACLGELPLEYVPERPVLLQHGGERGLRLLGFQGGLAHAFVRVGIAAQGDENVDRLREDELASAGEVFRHSPPVHAQGMNDGSHPFGR